uniref:Uncharacterized protein n=1 Tax=Meloidogyne enterolobii TaxID=390850 RepID=A0A6V7XJC2_MELEN|nr:unnamed protein product [Meloidogyne enterolobii]
MTENNRAVMRANISQLVEDIDREILNQARMSMVNLAQGYNNLVAQLQSTTERSEYLVEFTLYIN